MKTKYILSALILQIIHISSGLASENNRQTSLSHPIHAMEFVISGGGEFSSIGGTPVGTADLALGVVFNRYLTMGIYYQRSLTEFVPVNEVAPGLYAEYQSVGGILGFRIFTSRMVNGYFPVKFGYGHLEMDSDTDWNAWTKGEQHLFILQPGAFLGLNVAPFVRLHAGTTYRFTNNFAFRAISSSNMQGFTGQLGLTIHIPAAFYRNIDW